jgi:putative membrane protein
MDKIDSYTHHGRRRAQTGLRPPNHRFGTQAQQGSATGLHCLSINLTIIQGNPAMPSTRHKIQSRAARKISLTLTAAALAALALAATPAWAQSSGATGKATTGVDNTAAGAAGPSGGSTGVPGATGNSPAGTSAAPGLTTGNGARSSTAGGTAVAKADRQMMIDLAQGNMAEIAAAKMALKKSKNEETRKFAQQMIDDHTSAQQDVQKLASSKGVTLPAEPDKAHKSMAGKMNAMAANTFDKQYRSHAGVDDHKHTVALLQKIQKNGEDADLKALAGKMLPTVQQHLKMGQQLAGNKKS